MEANIHGPEWISNAVATYFINQLLSDSNPEVFMSFNWYIFPVVNPDALAYTHTVDRFWRKTRKRSLLCYGTDPNRNWDHAWGVIGTSTNPCSYKYAGSSPFSEVEVKNFADFLKTVENLQVYIDFHSFGQMLMFPYGNTTEHLGNYEELNGIAKKAVDAIRQKHGNDYIFGNIAETICEFFTLEFL